MRERPLPSLVASLLAVAALHNGRVDGLGVCSDSVALAEAVYIIERRTGSVRGDGVYRHVVAFGWLVASVECEVELPRAEKILILGTTPHVQKSHERYTFPIRMSARTCSPADTRLAQLQPGGYIAVQCIEIPV